jgi:hypothetical protein
MAAPNETHKKKLAHYRYTNNWMIGYRGQRPELVKSQYNISQDNENKSIEAHGSSIKCIEQY